MGTKPDGIPDDIWEAAMIEAAKYVEWAFQTRNVDADAEHVLATSISRMVLAERLKERERASHAAFDGEATYTVPRNTADFMAGYFLGRIHASQAIAPEEWAEPEPEARP